MKREKVAKTLIPFADALAHGRVRAKRRMPSPSAISDPRARAHQGRVRVNKLNVRTITRTKHLGCEDQKKQYRVWT